MSLCGEINTFTEQLRWEETTGNRLVGTHCSKEGLLEQAAQDLIQLPSEYLQGWRLCTLSGQPVPVSDHPYGKSFFRSV